MIITTAGRTSAGLVSKAKQLAQSYQIPYKERNGVSINTLKEIYQTEIVVVGKNRIVISPLEGDSELFFHPNVAMVRAKRMLKGREDPFVTTAQLQEGMSVLDCTLGLAADSIIASLAVGEKGTVTGIEGNPSLFLLAKEGLSAFSTGIPLIDRAMKRIEVLHQQHGTFLSQAEANSFDVVYFDPMFSSEIDVSNGINSIRNQAIQTDISLEVIEQAKRVARERVVFKDYWKSKRFETLGFHQHKRKTSLFHYGTIEL